MSFRMVPFLGVPGNGNLAASRRAGVPPVREHLISAVGKDSRDACRGMNMILPWIGNLGFGIGFGDLVPEFGDCVLEFGTFAYMEDSHCLRSNLALKLAGSGRLCHRKPGIEKATGEDVVVLSRGNLLLYTRTRLRVRSAHYGQVQASGS
jgi:hypothetical protein